MEFNFSPPFFFFFRFVHLVETSIYTEWMWVTKSKVRFMEIIPSKDGFVHSYSASRFFNCTSSFRFLASLPRFFAPPSQEAKKGDKDRSNQEQTYSANEASLFTEASLVICTHCLFSLIKMIHFVSVVLVIESCIWMRFFVLKDFHS